MFYKIMIVVAKILMHILFRIQCTGKENIPVDGPCIICVNHISNLDPVLVAMFSERQIHYIAKKELFEKPILKRFFKALGAFPVDRQSGRDINAYRQSIKYLKQGKVVGVFFEGTRVRDGEKNDGKSGAGMFAIKGKAPIVPVGISGKYSPFKKIKLNFGKPIYLDEYYDVKLNNDVLDEVMGKVVSEIAVLNKD